MTDGNETQYMSDRQRAFKLYKARTAQYGKPFFPFGVWHDIVAAIGVMCIIMLLTVVWFAQANCDSWFNVSCKDAATPAQQAQYYKGHPTKSVSEEEAKNKGVPGPKLGPLYEDKADPGTTSYDPRPEWYYYFLFELLRIFSNPNLVILGTIGLPTVALVLLMAWPFLDRRRERRLSRRPVAITAMGATAVVLLALTWAGAHAGKPGGGYGTPQQQAMPGYKLLFADTRSTCANCHTLGDAWSQKVGPDLTKEGTIKEHDLQWQIDHLKHPSDKTPNSAMPAQWDKSGGAYTTDEIGQIAAFLRTTGVPERASDPTYKDFKGDKAPSGA